jgi:hypothetical protein
LTKLARGKQGNLESFSFQRGLCAIIEWEEQKDLANGGVSWLETITIPVVYFRRFPHAILLAVVNLRPPNVKRDEVRVPTGERVHQS